MKMQLAHVRNALIICLLAMSSTWPASDVFSQRVNFVAISSSGDNAAVFSTNGIDWIASPGGLPAGGSWQSVAYGNGVYVAVANGTNAAYSTNGIEWVASPGGLPYSDGWISVAYGNGLFVTISGAGDSGAAYSTNGIDWTASPGGLPSPGSNGGAGWQSIAYGNGVFVAVPWLDMDTQTAAYSYDGINWTASSLPTALWNDVGYGNGVFVAVDGWGMNGFSTNGIVWNTSSSELPIFHYFSNEWVGLLPEPDQWVGVTYGNGMFVAVPNSDTNTAYSTDGSNWIGDSGALPVLDNWQSVAYGNGMFVVIANGSANAAYSTNGIAWTASPGGLPSSDAWISVAARQDPEITVQPVSQTAVDGGNVSLSVTAVGPPPLSYQWQFEGTSITGATNSSLNLTNVDCDLMGEYSVTVSNAFGSATSSAADLSVVVPIVAPSTKTGLENYPLPLSGISISGDPSGTNDIQLNVWATNGTLGFAMTNGLSFLQGANGGTTNLMVSGTLSNVNAALQTFRYVPDSNFYGDDSLTIEANCLGTGGVGGVPTNSATVALQVLSNMVANFVAISSSGDNAAVFSTNGIDWIASPGGLPSAGSWQSVAYGNGVYVAVAAGTNAAYSTNGIEWIGSPGGLPFSDGWISVTYGNGLFVTISGSGDAAAAYSTNGIDWIASPGGLPSPGANGGAGWQSVAYGNGVFVAVPWLDMDTQTAAYSYDGINWTASSLPTALWNDVGYGNGVFVAVDGWGMNGYSTNGIVWNTSSSELPIFHYFSNEWVGLLPEPDQWVGVTYGNGMFVAVPNYDTNTAYSTDGSNWIGDSGALPVPDNWQSIAYGNGMFVVIANGSTNAAYSTNGIAWTASPGGLPSSDGWISVAARQDPRITVQPLSQTAVDGGNVSLSVTAIGPPPLSYQWQFEGTSITGATNSSLNLTNVDCDLMGEYSVTVSNAFGSATSSAADLSVVVPIVAPSTKTGLENYPLPLSGISISGDPSGTNDIQLNVWATNGILGFAMTNGLSFLQGANGGTTNLMVSGTLSNVNAALQTFRYVPDSNFYGDDRLTIEANCLGTGGVGGVPTNSATVALQVLSNMVANFVAISSSGDNAAVFSTNGLDWIASPGGLPSAGSWQSVAYGNGVYVAVANGTNAAYSTNGIEWVASPGGLPSLSGWDSVAYGGGIFVAIAGSSASAYSTNGIDWIASPGLPTPSWDSSWATVAYGGGKFVALSILSIGGRAAYSTNGINWTVCTSPPELESPSVGYGNDTFAAVDIDGQAFYSTNGIDWITSSNGLPSFYPYNYEWSGLAYGNGLFVAVLNDDTNAAYSADGNNWTANTGALPVLANWQSVAYGSGTFVVIANGSTNAAYSTNGITWTASPGGLPSSDGWSSVAARQDPRITVQPVSQTAVDGGNVSFSVTVIGSPPLSYQWQFDGMNIIGATNANLAITDATNDGNYSVIVGNLFGTTVSSNAVLTIVSVASLAPANNTNCSLVNSNATLQTWSIPASANPAVSNLEIIATSTPNLPANRLPAGWSLDGVLTNITYVSIAKPGVCTVVCTAGASAMTNIIWVMENGDVEQGCSTNGSSLLGYWSFNSPTPWEGDLGQQPVADYGLQNPASLWGNALQVDTNTSANLSYRYMEADGSANINCINGAVSFWFKPDWNGGSGPGNVGQLLEIGDTNSMNGWWSLWVDAGGSSLNFQTKSNGVLTTYFTQSITAWSSDSWYQVALNYSPEQTSLSINGVLAKTGPGMTNYPTINNRLEYGFSLGSDHTGANQIRGTIDEVYTFDCPLSATVISNNYPAPVILQQPANLTNIIGGIISFGVTASGPNLVYRWQMDGTNMVDGGNISGSSTANLTIANLTQSDAAYYSVVVSNMFGTVESESASLTVLGFSGSSFKFPVFGPLGSNYWVMASTNLANWTTIAEGTLATDPVLFTDSQASSFNYRFYEVWNGVTCSSPFGFETISVPGGEINVMADQLFAAPNALVPDLQLPANHTMDDSTVTEWVGGSQSIATFSSTSESWSIPTLPIAPGGGAYFYNASNEPITVTFIGTIVDATMTNVIPAGFSMQSAMLPLAGSADALGLTAALTNGDYLYQWIVSGQTNEVYLRTNSAWNVFSNGLWVTASDPYLQVGEAVGINAIASASPGIWTNIPPDPPIIVVQPLSQQVFQGNTVYFSVTATNLSNPHATLTNQWYLNGTPLVNGGNVSGVTSNVLTISDAQATNEGTYSVKVGVVGAAGTVTSVNATLSEISFCSTIPSVDATIAQDGNFYILTISPTETGVTYDVYFSQNLYTWSQIDSFVANSTPSIRPEPNMPPDGFFDIVPESGQRPDITMQPASQIANPGVQATFSVSATGASLEYQWQCNGVNLTDVNGISGANQSTLTIGNVQAANVGAYTVVVANMICSVTSEPATLSLGQSFFQEPNGNPFYASPALGSSGTIYIPSAGSVLYAINPANGAINWSDPIQSADFMGGSPTVAGNTVYIGSGDGNLYALNAAANGQPLWNQNLNGTVDAMPAIGADGTVYIGSESGGSFALNSATGNPIWNCWAPGSGIFASPAIGPDCTIYFADQNSDLYAMTPENDIWNMKWLFPVPSAYFQSSPAVGPDGTIYIGSGDGYLHAITPDGTLKWEFDTGDGAAISSPVLDANGVVYFGTQSGNLYAVTNGVQKWQFSLSTITGGQFYASPCLGADGTVYIGADDGYLYAIGPNGQEEWSFQTQNGIYSSAVIGPAASGPNNVLYCASSDANIYAISLAPSAGLATSDPWPMLHKNAAHSGSASLSSCPTVEEQPPFLFDGLVQGQPASYYQFLVDGPPNGTWTVYASTDLTHWGSIGTVSLSSSEASYYDFTIAGLTNRFYTVRTNASPNNPPCSASGLCGAQNGFIELSVVSETNFIANPFYQVQDGVYPQNTLSGIAQYLNNIGDPLPDGTTIQKWNGTQRMTYTWRQSLNGWLPNGDATLLPGEAALLETTGTFTLPMAGLVTEGIVTNSIRAGTNYISSILPLAGRLQHDLYYQPHNNDTVYVLNSSSQRFSSSTYNATSGQWSGGEPVLGLGEGFILVASATNTWLQTNTPCTGIFGDPPTASGANLSTCPNTALNIDLTTLTADPCGYSLSYSISSQPTNGTVVAGGSSGQYVYTPKSNSGGVDTFKYEVYDGILSSTAIVTIAVGAAPSASDQQFAACEDSPLSITLNASPGNDNCGSALVYTFVGEPTKGTLSGTPGVNLTYTPNRGYTGADSFQYIVTYDYQSTPVTTVTITTGGPPTADTDSETTCMNQALNFSLNGNSPCSASLTANVVSSPSHGTLSPLNGTVPLQVIYTPNNNYSGSDSFTFTVTDGVLTSSPATVSLTVSDPTPTANDLSGEISCENTSLTLALTGSSACNEPLTARVVSGPSHGTVSPTTGVAPLSVAYTPVAGYTGSDSFTFTVSDGVLTSSPATASITVSGQAPTADDQAVTDCPNTILPITLTGATACGLAPNFTIVSGPTHGILLGSPPVLGYFPNYNYTGSDSFTFKTSIGSLSSSTATVSITVESGPLIITQPADVTTCSNETAAFSVSATGQSLSYQWRQNGVALSDGNEIAGSSTAMLTVSPVGPSDDGLYDVIVTDSGAGCTTISQPAALNVFAIIGQTMQQTVVPGAVANFSVTVPGSGSTFQWQLSTNGGTIFNNITGATSYKYTTPSVTLANNGNEYRVVVTNTNSSCTTTSLPAILNVRSNLPVGTVKWAFSANPEFSQAVTTTVDSSPALTNGFVFVQSTDSGLDPSGDLTGRLRSVNTNGTESWAASLGAANREVTSSPAVASNGTIYPASADRLFAIATNGTRNWTFDVYPGIGAGAESGAFTPAIGSNGTIFVDVDDVSSIGTIFVGELYGISPNGLPAWLPMQAPNAGELGADEVGSEPCVGPDGTVYFIGEFSGALYAVTNGQVAWSTVSDFIPVPSINNGGDDYPAPVIDSHGIIYVGAMAITPPTVANPDPTEIWDGSIGVNSSSPLGMTNTVAPHGVVYVVDYNGILRALDRTTGVEIWEFDPQTGNPDGSFSTPVIASNGTVYYGCNDNNLYAVSPPATVSNPPMILTTPLWQVTTGGGVFSSPTIGSDGTVYVGSRDGNIYAIVGTSPVANTEWPLFRKNLRNTGGYTP